MKRHARITREYENVVVVRFGGKQTPIQGKARRRDWLSEFCFGMLLLSAVGGMMAMTAHAPGVTRTAVGRPSVAAVARAVPLRGGKHIARTTRLARAGWQPVPRPPRTSGPGGQI